MLAFFRFWGSDFVLDFLSPLFDTPFLYPFIEYL